MRGKNILLIIGGGIAAYKALELVRRLAEQGVGTRAILTKAGAQFVTPLSVSALTGERIYSDLFSLTDEAEMGHIQLSRSADLVVVAPATADLMAKMANGLANDLASTALLATDKPVLMAPAMNVRMWESAPVKRNREILGHDGVLFVGPNDGEMACGEYGPGRLPEPAAVWQAICHALDLDEQLALLPAPSLFDDDLAEFEGGVAEIGGLSASLIQRSAVPLDPLDLPDDLPPPPPVPDIPLNLDTPILSKKGKARAAPPTDAEAINHLVMNQAPPEPLAAPLAEAIAADPLYGQPDFAGADFVAPVDGPLYGKRVLITAGPTHEPIDPVRYIANRSSGKQGYAIAAAAARLGAEVLLVSGPVHLPTPPGVTRLNVETAREMADAVKQQLPVDVAIMVAAVADWRTTDVAGEKMKKRGSAPPALRLTENPDILAMVAVSERRPKLVVGFAAETEKVIQHATEKRKRKGADWIVANDVSGDVMGGNANAVHIVTGQGVESLPEMPKDQVAMALMERIADALVPAPGPDSA